MNTSLYYVAVVGVGVLTFIVSLAVMRIRRRKVAPAKANVEKVAEPPVGYADEVERMTSRLRDALINEPKVLTEKITEKGIINARIYDMQHRTRYLRHVELIPGKEYGRQFLCGKDYVFALKKDGDKLTPVEPPKSMEHPPSELYEALQTKDDVKEVMGNRDESGDKLKLGLLVLAACVALFIMFMAVYKGGHG
jgi:hypothetical protein